MVENHYTNVSIFLYACKKSVTKIKVGTFPGGPAAKTLHFHCSGRRFDSWLGNSDSACHLVRPKEKKNSKIYYTDIQMYYIGTTGIVKTYYTGTITILLAPSYCI